MTIASDGLKEWRKRLENGEVERPATLTPTQKAKQNPKSLRLAINAKCFDCTCFQKNEVKNCVMTDCPLYQVRPWQ